VADLTTKFDSALNVTLTVTELDFPEGTSSWSGLTQTQTANLANFLWNLGNSGVDEIDLSTTTKSAMDLSLAKYGYGSFTADLQNTVHYVTFIGSGSGSGSSGASGLWSY
jgi:hypothetical protein